MFRSPVTDKFCSIMCISHEPVLYLSISLSQWLKMLQKIKTTLVVLIQIELIILLIFVFEYWVFASIIYSIF